VDSWVGTGTKPADRSRSIGSGGGVRYDRSAVAAFQMPRQQLLSDFPTSCRARSTT
jgi:hypothetical protein